ncbi:MAG: hypothetical protein K0Q93_3285, partial [Nocardioidaceae bacterium]|nr:hypothetical protein [Nocardioidaceae bacterium]
VHTLQRVHRASNARARGFRHRVNMRCDGPLSDAGSIQVSSGVAHLVPAFDMFSVFGSLAVVLLLTSRLRGRRLSRKGSCAWAGNR